MKLGFLGGGNMAAALIGGLLHKGMHGEDILVVELDAARRAWLREHFPVQVPDGDAALVEQADVLVLAVKPQQLRGALATLPTPYPWQLILSVAAGVRAADISRWLAGHGAVVRAMPNTPALIGAGITGLYALPGVIPAQREQASRVMEAVGQVVWVEHEALLDVITAVSGSGPAYVFYFIEALESAAISLGLEAAVARRLAQQTFFGAAALCIKDGAPPSELRARVTSKGGTTERAIEVLEQRQVRAALLDAVRAAAERSRELGELLGKDA
ncbi:MAG: pyrroline-5-carboxylate reductase [Thiobacillaceae bacterium]|nr:pyrroline-5-carboxylate reductase [Thiobacillaceae bacterium]